jgi:hypothetical protein
MAVPAYPVQVEIDYPESLSRWLIFVKWILIIPHIVVLVVYVIAAWFAAIASFFIILFTGTLPKGLWEFTLGLDRWYLRASAYALLLTDTYPPFTNQPADYPVRLSCDQPEKLSRGLVLVKWLLVIPHLIIVAVLGIAAIVITIIAWFAILFTTRYPRGLFDFVVGVMRWNARVTAYSGSWAAYNPYVGGLLRDEYPPFSLKP